MSISRTVRRKSALFAAVSLAFVAARADAEILTWTGGGADNNLSTAANWSGGVAPVANDELVFDGNVRLTPTNDFPVVPPAQTFNGVTFASPAGSFNLGGNAFILNGNINQNATANQTISAPILLDASTASVNFGAGAGTLSLGAVTFGAVAKSANVSSLQLNGDVSATSLLVQTVTASNNTLEIADGRTLTINGGVTVGTLAAAAEAGNVTNLVTAGSGNLVVNGGATNFVMGVNRPNETPGTTDPVANFNASSLRNFSYTGTTGEFRVGFGGNVSGTMSLASFDTASTNVITAGAIRVADSNNQNNGSTTATVLALGQGTNTLNATTFVIGSGKQAGQVNFQAVDGTVTIAGSTGGASTSNITIGSATSATGTNTVSNLNLNGHQATVQGNTVIIGRLAGGTGGSGSGAVSFDTGTFNANSLQIGVDTSGTAANGALGTFTLGGAAPNDTATGVLNVNSAFILGNVTSGNTATKQNRANFIVNGGTANINADIVTVKNAAATGTTQTTTLTLAGGTLNMMGHSIGTGSNPITNVNLPAGGQTATLSNLGGTGINGAGLTHAGGGTLILTGDNTYAGTAVIGAGSTLQVGTAATAGSLPAGGGITNDGTLNFAGSNAATISSGIGGAGVVNQDGAGTLTLAGGNTYTGGTNVNAGGVNVTGSLDATSAVNVNASAGGAGTLSGNGSVGNLIVGADSGGNVASIRPGATAADAQIGTLFAASLTVNGGNYRVDASAGADLIAVAGTADFAAPSTITVVPGAATGTHTILTAATLTGLAPTLTSTSAGRSTFGLNFDTTNNLIELLVTGGPLALNWTGAVNSTWDTSASGGGPLGTANWHNGTSADTFFEQDGVTFGNGPANRNITVSGTVTPGSTTFANNGSNPYTIGGSGGIGGIGGLSVTGGGTATLNTVNTFSGATTITSGTLVIGSTGSIASPSVTVAAGGTLNVNAGGSVSSSVALTNDGSVTLAGSNAIGALNGSGSLSTAGALGVSGGGAYSGVINGAGSINNTAGTLVLTNANAYTGGTTVSGGILQLGDGATAGSIIGNVTVSGAGTLGHNLPASATSSANISGTGGVAQLAANTLTLTGTLNYGATTVVGGGTVAFHGAASKTVGAIGGAGNVVVGDGTTAAVLNSTGAGTYTGTTTINAGSTLAASTLANGGAGSSIGAANNGAADLVIDGATLKWVGAASQTSNRNFSMSSAGATLDSSPVTGAAAITLNGTGTIAFTDVGPRTLTLAGTELTPLLIGTNVLNLVITDQEEGVNRTTVVKNGNNRWQFGGANNYTGGTQINAGGIRANNQLAFGRGNVTVADGAQAYLNAAGQFDNNFFIAGIGPAEAPGAEAVSNFGALRIANNGAAVFGTVTLTADARITGRSASTGGTIAGQITGNFNLEFGNTGGGAGNVIIFNDANDWGGNTIVSHGTLKAGNPNVMPVGAAAGNVIINNSSATLDSVFNLDGFSQEINGLESSGADTTRAKVTSANGFATITVGNNDATAVYNGVLLDGPIDLGGQLALAKVGSGTQTISGVNTYTGGTTVSAGTLRTTGAGTLGASGSAVTNNAALEVFSSNTVGGVSGGGDTTVGDGTTAVSVEAKHLRQASLSVANTATLKMTADMLADGVSNVGALTIAPTGRVDLNSNKLVTNTPIGSFTAGAYTGVQGEVARAYDFGAWDLPGLMTSQADALGGITTIGVATGEQILFLGPTDTGTFAGQTITGATTIAMYTYAGDLNFDGLVDASDYGVIDNFVQFPGTDGYANGDINYDGVIDAGDYGIIDNTIQLQGPPIPGWDYPYASSGASGASLSGVTAVPEPAAFGLALAAAASLLVRRRRRSIWG